MKKKFVVFMLVATLSIFSFGPFTSTASAAETNSTYLNYGDKTRSTSRVTVNSGERLKIYANWYRGDGVMTVFKNGSYYQTFVSPGGGGTFGYNLSAGPGEYSLRLYCGSPTTLKTNCSVPTAYIKSY